MRDHADAISTSVTSLQNELFSFIQRLVQTPSLPGKEQEAQTIVSAELSEMGLDVIALESRHETLKHHPAFCDDGIPFKNRINIVGRLKASPNQNSRLKGTGSLILNGHIDVVSAGNENLWDASPWGGAINGNRLYGRGSCDMKSGLACAIFAIKALQQLGFEPLNDLLFESVIGEETGGIGSLTTIIDGCSADAAIIMEPTELSLCPIQSGALTFRIKVPGHSVHACAKKSGVSAIEKFYGLLKAIEELEHKRHSSFYSLYYADLGEVAPINIGTINGGDWHSTVPNELIAEGRFGVFPGESVTAARRSFKDALDEAAAADSWLKDHPPTLEWFEGQFESGETNSREPFVQVLTSCHAAITGSTPKVRGVTYGSDLRLFTNYARIPAVLYGPGSVSNAHMVNEFVPLEEVLLATKVIALMIYQWCGGSLR
jgi:acetylornithine deacetylase